MFRSSQWARYAHFNMGLSEDDLNFTNNFMESFFRYFKTDLEREGVKTIQELVKHLSMEDNAYRIQAELRVRDNEKRRPKQANILPQAQANLRKFAFPPLVTDFLDSSQYLFIFCRKKNVKAIYSTSSEEEEVAPSAAARKPATSVVRIDLEQFNDSLTRSITEVIAKEFKVGSSVIPERPRRSCSLELLTTHLSECGYAEKAFMLPFSRN